MTSAKPRVAIIGTGGTISSVSHSSLDVLDYPDSGTKLEPAELLARVPELALFADGLAVPFRSVGSTRIGPSDWLDLARAIAGLGPEIAGVVILHGTATLEETAYCLSLVLKDERPVVLVGAQRPASAVSQDGSMNLVSAVRTAIAPEARGLGVLVVLNDEIHAAREVTKTSTYRLQTFRTPDMGLLGHVDGDRVALYRRPLRRHGAASRFDLDALARFPRVDIAYSYAGADGVAVEAFVAAGARGLVSAGLAPGIPAPLEQDALDRAATAGIVVVQASRAGSGRVARRATLREKGMVGADNLNPQKARILLALALTQTSDPDEIQRIFDTH